MPPTATPSPPPTSPRSGRLAPLSADNERLFAYGSLMFDEVLIALLGRIPTRTPAIAAGWRVIALPERVYPGLIQASGDADAPGVLIHGLTAAEWAVLDAFEDNAYQLRQLDLGAD